MRRRTTRVRDSKEHAEYVDALTGDRVFVPLQDVDGDAIPVFVQLALTAEAVQKAARDMGATNPQSSTYVQAALKRVSEGATRDDLIQERVDQEVPVALFPVNDTMPRMGGTLVVRSVHTEIRKDACGRSVHVRRRMGHGTTSNPGTLFVSHIDDVAEEDEGEDEDDA